MKIKIIKEEEQMRRIKMNNNSVRNVKGIRSSFCRLYIYIDSNSQITFYVVTIFYTSRCNHKRARIDIFIGDSNSMVAYTDNMCAVVIDKKTKNKIERIYLEENMGTSKTFMLLNNIGIFDMSEGLVNIEVSGGKNGRKKK